MTGQAIHPDARQVLEDLMKDDNGLLKDIENDIEDNNDIIDLNEHEDGVGDDDA